MADFGHLMATMNEVKNPAAPKAKKNGSKKAGDPAKKKKKKKKTSSGGDVGGAATKPKKKAGSTSGGGGAAKPAKVVETAADKAANASAAVSSRLGGPIAQVAGSKKATKATAVINNGPDLSKKSKIWLALNPQSMYAEERGAEPADEEDRNIISVRGAGAFDALDMEDNFQFERDEFGNVVAEESEGEEFGFESEDDGDLADFDEETMKVLKANREAREKEANQKRASMKAVGDKKKAEAQKILDAELAIIAKKKAKERKTEEISKADLKAAQKNAAELTFSFDWG